ncbi:MAG: hypothetical protein NTX22_18250 [Ignavibacteriales bacterium]|nr:hypothetical protein [Ignavibacteriales bacterium]
MKKTTVAAASLKYFLFITFFLLSGFANAQLLNSFQTKNLNTIFVDQRQYYLIPHLASCFENAMSFHNKLWDYKSDEQLAVLFHDFGDWGYAGAINIPFNLLIVAIEPFDYAYDVMPANERMNWLMNHELTHIVMCDKPNNRDRFFRSLFSGKVSSTNQQPLSLLYSFLASPRRYSPRWYHEGIAVFMETWMAGGVGRALGGYDEMVFRSMVNDSSYFYNAVGLESEGTTIDFQVGMNAYLYGTRFVNYLSYQYGPEKLLNWYKRTDDSYTLYDSQFKEVYKTTIRNEWDKWISFEQDLQNDNIKLIRENPTTEFKKIGTETLGSVSRQFYNRKENKIYAGINYPGQLAQISSISLTDGKIEKLIDMPSPALYYVTSLAYDDSSSTLFYTTNNSQNWRTINSYNLVTDESKTLIERARIGDLVFDKADKSLWGMQHNNGISLLVHIPFPYESWNTIYSITYGQDLFDIDVSPDGKYLTGTKSEISGKQKFVRIDIQNAIKGKLDFEELYEFENNSASNFVFSPDGKYLYGTSYLTGVSNTFRYDFEKKDMQTISNTETGFFRPIKISTDSILAFKYSGKGFSPVLFKEKVLEDVNAINYLGQKVIEKYPVLESWKAGSPAQIKIDSLTIYNGGYAPFNYLRFTSLYPIVEGYKVFPSYGLRLELQDPIQLSSISMSASYSPNKLIQNKQRIHLGLAMRYWNWEFEAEYNHADFYDLFGPTKTSRAGYSFLLQYNEMLIDETPKKMDYTIRAAAFGDLERVPDYQNVAASFDKLYSLSGDIKYSRFRKSLGSVDDEAGFSFQFNSKNNYVNKNFYPRVWANLNYGFLTPWNHSSIWFRGSVGNSFANNRADAFANFYFGGFGNNYVDYQEVRRYRTYYSFPGMELNSLGGTNFSKCLIEWDLPALRFREMGFLSFYSTFARIAFFSSGLITNFDKSDLRQQYLNVGTQLDFEVVLFSLLKSTISVGYGKAFNKYQKPSDEVMLSLKLL